MKFSRREAASAKPVIGNVDVFDAMQIAFLLVLHPLERATLRQRFAGVVHSMGKMLASVKPPAGRSHV